MGIYNGAANNTIGGTVSGAPNLISANKANGVDLNGSGTGNLVQGNFIGTDASGTAALGNASDGVSIESGTSNNTIGGTVSGAGNVIAYSGSDGVVVSGVGIAIRQNSIYNSTNLGIQLVGGNNNQPAPVLASAVASGNSIQGTLTAAANTSYALDFFANPTANPSGYGEGKQFLGSATESTNGSGTVSFTVTFNVSVPAGQAISATATDPSGNTSAFAKDVSVSSPFAPNAMRGSSSPDAIGAAPSAAYFAPSAAAALATGPVAAGIGDSQNHLSALRGSGGLPTDPHGGWTPFSSAVTAWSPSSARAAKSDHSATESLDLLFAAAVADDLLS